MNCPYCTREMENGYLRGNNSYELLWTEEPFKMTSLPTGNDFFVCAFHKNLSRRICRHRRQTGSALPCRIFCPTGRKQAQASQTFASADAK